MIFVDTSAWFATVVPFDVDHVAAREWLATNSEKLLTPDYVIDETLTLLKARGEVRRAIAIGDQFFRGTLATIYFLSQDDILAAWNVFTTFSDKGWSFTDCTSKAVVDKLQIKRAFAFDHHFIQFGSVSVVA